VASVARQDRPVQILLADNGAGVGRPLPEDVARAYAGRRLSLAQNRGFADGINRALSHVTTPFALVLNDDTVLDTGAAGAMRRALEGDARAVAVAPKILLAGHPLVLDAVGTVVRPDGLAFTALPCPCCARGSFGSPRWRQKCSSVPGSRAMRSRSSAMNTR